MYPTRSKRTVYYVVAAVILTIYGCTFFTPIHAPHHDSRINKLKIADIVEARGNIENEIYSSLNFKDEDTISRKCEVYFKQYETRQKRIDLEFLATFELDELLYKKKRWFRNYSINRKKVLSKQGIKFGTEHEVEASNLYNEKVANHVKFESQTVDDFNHLRIFGKCFLEENEVSDELCKSKNELNLYPWYSGKYPLFSNWEGKLLRNGEVPIFKNNDKESHTGDSNQCSLRKWQKLSNGKGFVFPVVGSFNTDNLKRIIKVLRVLQNDLPIQVIHVGALSSNDIKAIIDVGRTELFTPPESHRKREIPFNISKDYPKQDIWFVDLRSVVDQEKFPNFKDYSSFHLSLSYFFNSFQDAIILSDKVIPLLRNLGTDLFNNERYQKYGITLFKSPSYPTTKMRKFDPGFHEVTSLLKDYLMPSIDDHQVFGIFQRDKVLATSNRVLEKNFQQLLDPNLIVLNKSKVLSGLLITCNMQFYKIFHLRFKPPNDKLHSVEYLWIGQEIAGTNEKVNFNMIHGTGLGVLTPSEKRPYEILTTSEELCSSSWGQVDDADVFKLLYVTSHQGENWMNMNPSFPNSIKERFSIPVEKTIDNVFLKDKEDGEEAKKITIEEMDTRIFDETFAINPYSIQLSMLPATLDTHVGDEFYLEPKNAWFEQVFAGSQKAHPYWCCYDIVGSPDSDQRGRIISYNNATQSEYNFLTDVWLQTLRSVNR
ncbi:putative alpha-1,3-mannosyltransferase Mnt4p [[Candida] anglica]|uniref:Alpha-1,3-mannosyltransferase Mnt4p n=1 Tax=[Candida] anglica TaxID=148631 RepID=A0ABP0ELV2_9ASCO